jgi:hypothetical protein
MRIVPLTLMWFATLAVPAWPEDFTGAYAGVNAGYASSTADRVRMPDLLAPMLQVWSRCLQALDKPPKSCGRETCAIGPGPCHADGTVGSIFPGVEATKKGRPEGRPFSYSPVIR